MLVKHTEVPNSPDPPRSRASRYLNSDDKAKGSRRGMAASECDIPLSAMYAAAAAPTSAPDTNAVVRQAQIPKIRSVIRCVKSSALISQRRSSLPCAFVFSASSQLDTAPRCGIGRVQKKPNGDALTPRYTYSTAVWYRSSPEPASSSAWRQILSKRLRAPLAQSSVATRKPAIPVRPARSRGFHGWPRKRQEGLLANSLKPLRPDKMCKRVEGLHPFTR